MTWPLRTCLAVAVLFLFCAGAHAVTPSRSYESPRLASGAIHIRSACIMPVEGKLSRLGMKGGEGMAKESDDWSTALQAVVENHFKSAEVTLYSASSALDSNASDEELRELLLDLQQKYQTVAAQIERKPKDVGKEHFTLGDSVSLLPCSAKSDVLVFAEGDGQVLTGGKQAMGILVGGPSTSMASLRLTVIDAKTGEVLLYINMLNNGEFTKDSEKAFGGALDKQLRKMHVGPAADNSKP